MRSLAFVILALSPFVVSLASAGPSENAGFFFQDSQCYSRFGSPVSISYCLDGIGHAHIPKVEGKGKFADCVLETALDLLDYDASPLHFLPDGSVMAPPSVKRKIEGNVTTYTITTPGNRHFVATQRVVTVVRKGGNIAEIKSVAYSQKPEAKGFEKDNTTITHYTYPNGMCEIDRIESDVRKGAMEVTYDHELCQDVMRVVQKRTPKDVMSRRDVASRVLAAVHDHSVEIRENASEGLMYSEVKGEIPVLMQSCRNAGTPVDLTSPMGAAPSRGSAK